MPKKELVSSLRIVLESHRLKVARSLPEADTLVKELQNFQVRITLAANEQFGAWREGHHDDLVLAVALAIWWAERRLTGPFPVHEDRAARSIVDNAPKGVFLS